MSEKSEMTRKEALAVVHKYVNRARYLSAYTTVEEDAVLSEQIWKALRVLSLAIHGNAPIGIMDRLCENCYLHYVPTTNPFVYLRESPIVPKDLCLPCLERLRTEGKIERLENWQTGEVTRC